MQGPTTSTCRVFDPLVFYTTNNLTYVLLVLLCPFKDVFHLECENFKFL
jgi:hypothetical protein